MRRRRIAVILIVVLFSLFALFLFFPRNNDCGNMSLEEILYLLDSRIKDLGGGGGILIRKYLLLSIKRKADPLGGATKVNVIINDKNIYELKIYDDCYSKWFH